MPFHVGPGELLIVLAIVIGLYGARRFPQVGNVLDRALGDLRRARSILDVRDTPGDRGRRGGIE